MSLPAHRRPQCHTPPSLADACHDAGTLPITTYSLCRSLSPAEAHRRHLDRRRAGKPASPPAFRLTRLHVCPSSRSARPLSHRSCLPANLARSQAAHDATAQCAPKLCLLRARRPRCLNEYVYCMSKTPTPFASVTPPPSQVPPSRLYLAPSTARIPRGRAQAHHFLPHRWDGHYPSHYPIPYADDPVTVSSPQQQPMVRYCLCAWAAGTIGCCHDNLTPSTSLSPAVITTSHRLSPLWALPMVLPQPAQRRSHSCTSRSATRNTITNTECECDGATVYKFRPPTTRTTHAYTATLTSPNSPRSVLRAKE